MEKDTKRELKFLAFFTVEVILLLATFVGTFALFFYFSWKVFLAEHEAFDQRAFEWVMLHRSASMTSLMKFTTYFASERFLWSVPLAITLFYLLFRKWRWFSVYVFVATAGSTLLNQYLKFNFERDRPQTAFYHQDGFSFPSGHAMIGAAFYGILIYLLWRMIRNFWLRLLLTGALTVWVLMISYSRVYLNVHYATDVLAGLAAGTFWVVLTVVFLRQIEGYFYRQKIREMDQQLEEENLAAKPKGTGPDQAGKTK